MSYDKENRRITIEGPPGKANREKFEGDLLSFMSHVTSDVDRQLKARKRRIASRAIRVGIAGTVTWFLLVFLAAGLFEFPFGRFQYHAEEIFALAIIAPIVATISYLLFQWAFK